MTAMSGCGAAGVGAVERLVVGVPRRATEPLDDDAVLVLGVEGVGEDLDRLALVGGLVDVRHPLGRVLAGRRREIFLFITIPSVSYSSFFLHLPLLILLIFSTPSHPSSPLTHFSPLFSSSLHFLNPLSAYVYSHSFIVYYHLSPNYFFLSFCIILPFSCHFRYYYTTLLFLFISLHIFYYFY
jgi:hypothetical protein